jgi:hypothetical protein
MLRRARSSVRLRWLLAPLVLAAGTARAESPPAARLVGPDAVFYAEINRPGTLLDRAADERVQAALEAVPGYKAALQKSDYRQFRAVVDFVAGALGTTWEDGLRDLTGGGVALAIEGREKPERVFLVVYPRDAAFLDRAHAKLLELARKDAADKGNPDPVKEGEHRGIKGYNVAPNEAHAIVDGRLIVANGSETLKAVIDRALDKSGPSLADDAGWKARRAAVAPDALGWAFLRLDRLRAMDKKYAVPDQVDAGATLLFGHWVEAIRKAPWASAALTWTEGKLAADVTLPTPPGGYGKAQGKTVPPATAGAAGLLNPPGTIASLTLWRDLSALWEVRTELLAPEALQGLAQLDTTAGTFFGGRDFGTGVLGALASDWRLVVARQEAKTLDPLPDVKLPAFALVIGLKPDDEEFATRLQAAFQSFVGLANLGAAQEKAPPLMLGSETCEGVTIATSKFQVPKGPPPKGEPVHQRHNFSPSSALVGDHFILSSSLGLTRDLIRSLKSPAKPTDDTLVVAASGAELAGLIEQNRDRLVMQNMLEKGNDKARAEGEIGLLAALARYLGQGTLTSKDRPESLQFRLDFHLGAK